MSGWHILMLASLGVIAATVPFWVYYLWQLLKISREIDRLLDEMERR